MLKWVVGGLVSALGVAATLALQAGASNEVPTVIIHGVAADPSTFSLTTLRIRDERDLVQTTRSDLYDQCLDAKGFHHVPDESDYEAGGKRKDYARAWGKAAFGDDGKSYTQGPALEPQVVTLADGRKVELFTSWTPDTCWYRSYTQLGVDALVHEALRQTLTMLVYQADRAAVDDLGSVTARWADCLGSDADPQDLLSALDGVAASRTPYGSAGATCLTHDIRSEAMGVRAPEHLRVAADNIEVVEQWVGVLNRELAEAQERAD